MSVVRSLRTSVEYGAVTPAWKARPTWAGRCILRWPRRGAPALAIGFRAERPNGTAPLPHLRRRLTPIDLRSVEQPANPGDGDDIFFRLYLHVGMSRIFPNREVKELGNDDPIFDLDDRYPVANLRATLRDGRGHVMVAMTFNSDPGDSRQLADEPRYPEKYSALACAMSH